MKKSLIVLSALLLVAATPAMAGKYFKIGAKVGLVSNRTDINADNIGSSTIKSLFKDSNTGFQAGLTLRATLPVIPLFVQPELLYCWNKYEASNTTLSEQIGNIKVSDFEVPLMLGIAPRLGSVLTIRGYAGPCFNFATQVSVKDTKYEDLAQLFEKPTVTWGAGLGLDFVDLISIDFRYYGQFKSTDNQISWEEIKNVDTKNKSWSVSLGILF